MGKGSITPVVWCIQAYGSVFEVTSSGACSVLFYLLCSSWRCREDHCYSGSEMGVWESFCTPSRCFLFHCTNVTLLYDRACFPSYPHRKSLISTSSTNLFIGLGIRPPFKISFKYNARITTPLQYHYHYHRPLPNTNPPTCPALPFQLKLRPPPPCLQLTPASITMAQQQLSSTPAPPVAGGSVPIAPT